MLPARLDLNAVDLLNELERADSFEATLGALAGKERARLQEEWDYKNARAGAAKGAAEEAAQMRNDVKRHFDFSGALRPGKMSGTDRSLRFGFQVAGRVWAISEGVLHKMQKSDKNHESWAALTKRLVFIHDEHSRRCIIGPIEHCFTHSFQ